MKKLKYILGLALLTAAAAGVTSCQDDIDAPGLEIPVASLQPNTTIKELKEIFWQDLINYTTEVGTRDDGSHYIIAGRVVSSDEAGNVFKNLILQDATGAITFSIDSYNLTQHYRVGQEIVVDVTGLTIGKYAGLMQFGISKEYLDGTQASFMSRELFALHAELNGLPETAKIDTLVLDSFDDLVMNQDGYIKYQSQFVRFNNVSFVNGGKETFSTYHSNVNQDLVDSKGNGASNTVVAVRTSGYSNFWNNLLPEGSGDVCGILSFYSNGSSSNWQLVLNDIDDCMNFGNPTLPSGTRENPYSVEQAVALANGTVTKSGWMTGYIAGAVAPEVTEVTSDNDIEWGADVTLNNTLVIAPAADVKDYTKCVVVELPQGSSLRTLGNLRDNPANIGKQIWITGTFAKVLGMAGVAGNSGASTEWEIEGITPPVEGAVTSLDETFENGAIPQDWTQVQIEGTKTWYVTSFSNNYYAAMTGYKGTAPFDSWLLTPPIDIAGVSNKLFSFRTQVAGYGATTTTFDVYVLNSPDPATATMKVKLSPALPSYSSSAVYSDWVNSGDLDLSGFTGTIYIGFQYAATQDANYATWCLDDVKLGEAGDTPTPPTPPSGDYKGDFDSFNGGTPKASPYGTYENATGWKAENSIILGGSSSGTDQNPRFTFIGGDSTLAPTLNGKASAPGRLYSPTLTGGIKTLTFNYGFAFSDTKCQFTVNVMQNGAVAKTQTVTVNPVDKGVAQSFSMDVNLSGEFSIEIVNDHIGDETGNRERVSIWNLTWTD